MYKAALIEDEGAVRNFLSNALQQEFERQHISVSFDLFETGDRFLISFYEHYHYDLIFLDIEMPGTDGIQVCRQIRKLAPNALVVFISSQESLVFDTFEVQPFRFIRKNRFESSLPELVDAIGERLKHSGMQMIYLTEPGTGDIYSFELGQVLYIEAQRKDCRIVTYEGECLIRCPMRYVETELASYPFLKPHRSFLVNCAAVFYIGKNSILLTNRTEIPISRGQVQAVKEQFLKYSAC